MHILKPKVMELVDDSPDFHWDFFRGGGKTHEFHVNFPRGIPPCWGATVNQVAALPQRPWIPGSYHRRLKIIRNIMCTQRCGETNCWLRSRTCSHIIRRNIELLTTSGAPLEMVGKACFWSWGFVYICGWWYHLAKKKTASEHVTQNCQEMLK